jgi:hypothetical protein
VALVRRCMRSVVEQVGLERRVVSRGRVRLVGIITRSVCRHRVGVWPGVCSSREWCIEYMRLMMTICNRPRITHWYSSSFHGKSLIVPLHSWLRAFASRPCSLPSAFTARPGYQSDAIGGRGR